MVRWRGRLFSPRYGYAPGWSGFGWRQDPFFDRRYDRAVALLMRDRASGEALFEAHASNEGMTMGSDALLTPLFDAALAEFPKVNRNHTAWRFRPSASSLPAIIAASSKRSRKAGMALNIVIMAAGKGTRMKSATPKVLHKLAGRSLLAHVLKSVRAARRRRRASSSPVTARTKLKPLSPLTGISFVRQMPQLGTGHAIQQVVPVPWWVTAPR